MHLPFEQWDEVDTQIYVWLLLCEKRSWIGESIALIISILAGLGALPRARFLRLLSYTSWEKLFIGELGFFILFSRIMRVGCAIGIFIGHGCMWEDGLWYFHKWVLIVGMICKFNLDFILNPLYTRA